MKLGVRANLLQTVLVLMFPFFAGCLAFHSGPMPGEPRTATFADVDGVRMRYVDVGKGPVVTLIHGFGSSIEAWELLIPTLAKDHRVVALDLKGFGWTDRPEGDYSPEAQARLVLRFLAQRGVERTALVAHSWGAAVALAVTLAAPDRVSKLALYDAWVYEEQLPAMFHWARADGFGETLFALFYTERVDEKISLAFYDKAFVTDKLVTDVERAMERPGTTAAALAAVRGQRFAAVQSRYRKIDQPALLLWGREDIVTPLPYGERLAADLPHAKLVVYPRCGHFPMLEARAASTQELVTFLAEPAP